jgi:hypothetical protein
MLATGRRFPGTGLAALHPVKASSVVTGLVLWSTALPILSSCRSHEAPPRNAVIWRQVGSWAGRGDLQTESFTSDTGGFRVRWETRNETTRGTGRLKVVFRSGDSGRPIIEAVDVRGVGHDTEEVADNVRWYFLTIESTGVDWKVIVEERLQGHSTR